MLHAKRLFLFLLVFAMVFAYVLYDYSARKLSSRTTANISKISNKMGEGESDSTLDDNSESGDGPRSFASGGVDIGDDLRREKQRKRLTGSTERGFSEMMEERDDIAQLARTTLGKESRKRRLPRAIIIGVKKGGTRALLEILKIHPRVRASNYEAHFFDRDENYMLGLDWYRDQMPLSSPDQITMEKSPSYFVTGKAPWRIYQMSANIKLLVIVRDPTLRAISDYTQSLYKHPENPPFEELVLNDRQKGTVNANWSKIVIGRYAQHLMKWLKLFTPNQLHFVSGEELINNPAAEIRPVEKFLGLEPYITEENFYFNKTKGFFCFVGKRGDDGRVMKRDGHCMGSTKGRKHPPIREDVLKIVRDYYRPLNKEFYVLAKRDFNWP